VTISEISRKYFFFPWLFTAAIVLPNDFESVRLSAKPFTDVDSQAVWNINRLVVSNGVQVFVAPLGEQVMRLDLEGRFLGTVGRQGQGPGEYSGKTIGLAAHDRDLFLVVVGRLLHYRDGSFVNGFRLPDGGSFGSFYRATNSATIGVTNERIVIPSADIAEGRALATIFSWEGEKMGSIADPEMSKALIDADPMARNSLWKHHRGKWYAVYAFYPKLLVYDSSFRFEGSYQLDSPYIREYRENHPSGRRPLPLFWDIDAHGEHLLLSTQGGLHRIDATKGEVDGLISFASKGDEDWDQLPVVVFHAFAILDDGRIVLGNNNYERLFWSRLPE